MKVLLVDDEEELVVTLAERLSIRDIDADWALSGEDALRNMQQRLRSLRDPAKPAVDELLDERRAEAARE